MPRISVMLAALAALTGAPAAALAQQPAAWTIVLHPADYVIGDGLKQLHTRRPWTAGFNNETGAFEVALRKKAVAVAVPAPDCRMDYLILTIPFYYPDTPKQASVGERR